MTPRAPTLTAALAAALVLGSCGRSPSSGQLVFGVASELRPELELDRLEVVVEVDGVVLSATSTPATDLELPLEVPVAGQPAGALARVTARAFVPGGVLAVTRSAAAEVPASGEGFVLVPLAFDCAATSCAEGLTCAAGECVSDEVEPLPYDPSWRLPLVGDFCDGVGEPLVMVGQGQSSYAPVQPGEVLQLEAGPQGGHHVWMAIRTRNLGRSGSITTLSASFPELGYEPFPFSVVFPLSLTEAGMCQLFGLRFQLDTGRPIADLFGQKVELSVKVSDSDDDEGSATVSAVLSDDTL